MSQSLRQSASQKIVLRIRDKTLTKLAGNPYGKHLFDEQVREKIDLSQPFEIEFPPQIDFVAVSFIQGFFGVMNREIGIDGVQNNLTLVSNVPNLKDKVIKGLLVL